MILPMIRSKGIVPWYLKGCVSKSDCLGAYQAIGAASLAASYINLVKPGTYNLTANPAAPSFDTDIGWTFNGSNTLLRTGFTPAAGQNVNMTMIMRFSGVAATGYIGCGYTGTAMYFVMTPNRSGVRKYWNGVNQNATAPSSVGTIAIAGGNTYINGYADAAPFEPSAINGYELTIGGLINVELMWAGNIQAFAFYNTVLTAAQILAISNAMEALPARYNPSIPAFPGPTLPDINAGEFTVAFFTDAHIGSWTTNDQIASVTKYLKDHASRLNIQAVLYGGDFEDSVGSTAARAQFVSCMADLAGIPHLLAIGNHDYDSTGGYRNSAVFNGVFGQDYYKAKSWWTGDFCESGHSENAYLLLTIGAVDYIFITMEFFPRQAVIDWLNSLLTTYSTRKAIIVTHAYEYNDNTPYSVGNPFGPDGEQEPICDADYHWGDEVWTELVKLHDNIILVHSGHITYAARHSANSDGGQPINQVLFNYQGDVIGQASHMRFMVFNPTSETIRVDTFSPPLLTYKTGSGNQFTMSY